MLKVSIEMSRSAPDAGVKVHEGSVEWGAGWIPAVRVNRDRDRAQPAQSPATHTAHNTHGNTRKKGDSKNGNSVFSIENNSMLMSFGKKSLYRWLQKCQNSWTMHVFDRKNWISFFFISLLPTKGGSRILVRGGGPVEFWPPGGPEPKICSKIEICFQNCLKTAWFWKQILGARRARTPGPPGSASECMA